jgi:HSP20 family molecular chaperone IbpA
MSLEPFSADLNLVPMVDADLTTIPSELMVDWTSPRNFHLMQRHINRTMNRQIAELRRQYGDITYRTSFHINFRAPYGSDWRDDVDFEPNLDVFDLYDAYEVLVDLPGVSKDDVEFLARDDEAIAVRGIVKSKGNHGALNVFIGDCIGSVSAKGAHGGPF